MRANNSLAVKEIEGILLKTIQLSNLRFQMMQKPVLKSLRIAALLLGLHIRKWYGVSSIVSKI
jgi:hypothetical protein